MEVCSISTIIFLASLASVPEEEYEAARVDGAGAGFNSNQ